MQQTSQDISKKEILFPNGNRAQLVIPPAGANAVDTLDALGIEQPKSLLMLVGGAAGLDETLEPRLVQLFNRGIAKAAATSDALIIDGGTEAGVMEMMGQGVADRGRKSLLLGVAPAGKVTYPDGPDEDSIADGAPLDPNHSHFVLVESDEWGGETDTMYELASALAKEIPVVTVLANGGDITKDEVLRSVRQGWPIIVIKGSGRLADEITRLLDEKSPSIDDPVMAEIIEDGDIYLFTLSEPIPELIHLMKHHLKMNNINKFEEYKLFIEDTARFTDRRQTVNNIYVAVNSIILTAIALLVKDAGLNSFWRTLAVMPMLAAGIVICLQWDRLLIKYKKLVGFRINHLRKMENLPEMVGCHRMYHCEDELYPRDMDNQPIPGKGLNFSARERWLPWVFIMLYSLFALFLIGFVIHLLKSA